MASNKKDQMPNLWVASACHMHWMRVHTDARATQEVFHKHSVSLCFWASVHSATGTLQTEFNPFSCKFGLFYDFKEEV